MQIQLLCSNNNQAATNATNQAVTVTGSISNTSLTTAQLASHIHVQCGSPISECKWYKSSYSVVCVAFLATSNNQGRRDCYVYNSGIECQTLDQALVTITLILYQEHLTG